MGCPRSASLPLGDSERRKCQRWFQQALKTKTRQPRAPPGLLCFPGHACPGVGHPRAGESVEPEGRDGTAGSTRPASGLGIFVCLFVFIVFCSSPRSVLGAQLPRRAGERGGGAIPRGEPVLRKREIKRVKKKQTQNTNPPPPPPPRIYFKSNTEGEKKESFTGEFEFAFYWCRSRLFS